MAGPASIETTLELWASSLRDVKARIRPLFGQERVAASAGQFLDGLLGNEPRKTGWMRAEAAGDPDRLKAAHVPDMVGFATKPRIACRMIARAIGAGVPFSFVAADSAYGTRDVETMLRKAGKGYVLGVASNHVFRSWGKRQLVGGTTAKMAQDLPKNAWRRLSAGEGTKGPRLDDGAYLEPADLDAGEYNSALTRKWTRGLLIRRNIADFAGEGRARPHARPAQSVEDDPVPISKVSRFPDKIAIFRGFMQRAICKRSAKRRGRFIFAADRRSIVMLVDPKVPPKAGGADLLGRFREVIADPINLLIERVPFAGAVHANEVCLLNGNRVPVSGNDAYYGMFSQLLVVNRGVHEPLQEYVFQELLKRLPQAPQMIELGAYWAHYSMWLQKVRPQAKNIMVEPNPAGLAVGRSNFTRNGFVGEFIQAAVARAAWQVDPFLQSRAIGQVDILHADIEGFEVEMVEGATMALRKARIDYLFISTHSQQRHHEIIRRLKEFDYRIEVSSDFDHETTSYDGLIFASSPRTKPMFTDFVTIGRATRAIASPDVLLQTLDKIRRSAA